VARHRVAGTSLRRGLRRLLTTPDELADYFELGRRAGSPTQSERRTALLSDPAFALVVGGGYGIRTREGFHTQHDFQFRVLMFRVALVALDLQ
jgi:hypothetical protein